MLQNVDSGRRIFEQTKEAYRLRGESFVQKTVFVLRAVFIQLVVMKQIEAVLKQKNIIKTASPKLLDVGCHRGDKINTITDTFAQVLGQTPLVIGGDLHFPKDYKTGFLPVEMNVENLPFQDNSFDVVTGFAVHHHFPSLEKAFLEMERVLKSGGILCLVDTHYYDDNFVYKVVSEWFMENIFATFDECGGYYNKVTSADVKKALSVADLNLVTDFWSPPFLRAFIATKK